MELLGLSLIHICRKQVTYIGIRTTGKKVMSGHAVGVLLEKIYLFIYKYCRQQSKDGLTAFSVDDPEAAKSILESFVAETRLNAERLQKAVENEDVDCLLYTSIR